MDTKSGDRGNSDEKKQKRKRLKKLQSDIQRQVEFYFSDSNLRKDRFLKQAMDKAENGYIDIATITNFNRMRTLTTDSALVVRALENSDLLELSEDKTMIKRRKPLKKSKYNVDDLTVYVENLPHNVDHDMLKKIFISCGSIAYISLPRYKVTKDPKRFAFIEFTTPNDAARACKLLDNPSSDKPDVDGRFPLTRKGRMILPESSGKRQPTSNLSEKHGKEKALKIKREASETEEKPSTDSPKKRGGVKEEATGDGKDKVTKSSKRKRETTEGHEDVDEGAQHEKKAKRKTDTSNEEDIKKHDRRSLQEKDSSKKLRNPPAHISESLKRKRDDSTSSIDSAKDKRSSSDREDVGDAVKDSKRKRADSEMIGDEDGDGKRKKRSRSRKHKKDEVEAPSMPLRVIPKKEWLELKQEYLAIQKASMQELKKTLRENKANGQRQDQESKAKHKESALKENKEEKKTPDVAVKSTEPEYVPGVVVKISSDKPFPSRKNIREQLQGISPVAYIDLQDGDTSGFVRLQSSDGAKAVLGQASKLSNDSGNFQVALVSGKDEQMYWEKLKADRVTKLAQTKRKKKKRGVDRILDKSKKNHKHFDSK